MPVHWRQTEAGPRRPLSSSSTPFIPDPTMTRPSRLSSLLHGSLLLLAACASIAARLTCHLPGDKRCLAEHEVARTPAGVSP
ncbi:hypothetical protein C5615_28395 [Burkholderia cepacia]|uniref:Uncharacterized protein n=1 Tax=Burkholderia cepacia TaxID=292 RepID=A0A2S8IGF5_BURCE|nr:hypothetical protein C5615_28395 [Burkholderia cepacia]